MIYFIQTTDKTLVYIFELTKRRKLKNEMNIIRKYCPFPFNLMTRIEPYYYRARDIRRKFQDIRLEGYWFKYTDELGQFIKNLQDNPKFEYTRPKTSKVWTSEKLQILKESYDKLPRSQLCETLGLTWTQIKSKALALGLRRGYFLRRRANSS